MASVFLVREASLHAWKNLGLDDELKRYLEESFSPDLAYLLAICFLPWYRESRVKMMQDYGTSSSSRIFEDAWNADPSVLYSILQALHKRSDPKLPGILKSDAHRIARMSVPQAEEYFKDLESRVNVPAPEGYEGAPLFDSLDGWKWVRVDDQSCRDHEGALMQHCGQMDHSDMISLRDPNGKPHITAQVDMDTLPWKIYQFKGKQNRAPARQYWKYALDFFQQIARETGRRAELHESWPEVDDPDNFMGELIRKGLVRIVEPEYEDEPLGGEGRPEDEIAFFADE